MSALFGGALAKQASASGALGGALFNKDKKTKAQPAPAPASAPAASRFSPHRRALMRRAGPSEAVRGLTAP